VSRGKSRTKKTRAAAENERGLRMLADVIPQIVCTAGPDGRIDYFNRRWFEFTGLSRPQTFERRGWRRAIHPDDRPAIEARLRETAATGRDFSVEARVRSHSGRYSWFLARAVALRARDGSIVRFFCTATDIDDQKRVEEREAFLLHASDVLGSTLDAATILRRITELCVPAFADWCQVQSLSADDQLVVEAVRHRDPELNELLERLVGRSVIAVGGATLGSPHVLRQSKATVLNHEATQRAVRENVADAQDRAIYEAAGLGAAVIVPLVAHGRTQGTLHLVDVDPASRRPEIARHIAEELAQRAALAIDNSRLYEREHRVAAALQRAMLPARLPSNEWIDLSYAYRPAERESRVGGDWYDAFMLTGGRIGVSIGDVGGHGLEAAVAMNEARQALRLTALEGMPPAQIMQRANVALMLSDERPIITAVYGVIDVARGTFEYSCSGHPPPALGPLSGTARYLQGGGIPLGVDDSAPFPALDAALEPYDTLLLYTDGLIEFSRNIERESLRLLDALTARITDIGPDGAAVLLRHMLDERPFDDIAVLAATVLPAYADDVELRLPAAPSSAAIARRLASRYARVAKLSPERTFDLTIAVGEAVANAVEHAYLGRKGDFIVRLALRDGKVAGEVQDLGTWRNDSPAAERGRGLTILRATTQQLELNRSGAGTTVAFTV
jgi:PAS domain S-box-containing protein